jgi:hypothetical protein
MQLTEAEVIELLKDYIIIKRPKKRFFDERRSSLHIKAKGN